MEIIESSLNNYTIGSFLLEKHSHTALIELYASGREIPVYYTELKNRYMINAFVSSADRIVIFKSTDDEFKYIEKTAIVNKVAIDAKLVEPAHP